LLTIALPGVSAWRRVLPVLQALQPQQVQLAFDADWRINSHVARALGQTACALVAAGYMVELEDWDPALGKGIDDLLAAGHLPSLTSATLAFGASLRGRACVWTGTLATMATAEVKPWH